MGLVSFTTDDSSIRRYVERLRPELQKGSTAIARKVAYWTFGELIKSTPKKWTGQTRRSWQVVSSGLGFLVSNVSKVMLFLEEGTKSHGPVTANRLFIPLTRKAALSTGDHKSLVRGVNYVLAKQVKGVTPHWIVRSQKEKTSEKLYEEMTSYVRSVIA